MANNGHLLLFLEVTQHLNDIVFGRLVELVRIVDSRHFRQIRYFEEHLAVIRAQLLSKNTLIQVNMNQILHN